MHRIVLFCATVISLGIIVSCSGSGSVTQKNKQSQVSTNVKKYPTWYSDHSVVYTDTVIYAYATAIDEDSASAMDKAVDWAKSEMQSSLSDKFENIRLDAQKSKNSDSGLDQPGFLLALRKSDNAVDDLARTENVEVKTVSSYNSFRSFAEVVVTKNKLIGALDKKLRGHEKAWTAMKKSDAFKNF